MAFVWRVLGLDEWVLLGSGPLVGNLGQPKGIQSEQFSITFALPNGYAADEVVVTDAANSKARLPAVIRGPYSDVLEFKTRGNSNGGRAAIVTNAFANIKPSPNHRQKELWL